MSKSKFDTELEEMRFSMKTSLPIHGKCVCSVWLSVNMATHDIVVGSWVGIVGCKAVCHGAFCHLLFLVYCQFQSLFILQNQLSPPTVLDCTLHIQVPAVCVYQRVFINSPFIVKTRQGRNTVCIMNGKRQNQFNKQPPVAVSKSCKAAPLTGSISLLWKSPLNDFTSFWRWEKPRHSSQVFSSAAQGPFAQRKAQGVSRTDCTLSSICDNVHHCVRCRRLTLTSNSCVVPATAGARKSVARTPTRVQENESFNVNSL